MAQGNSYNVTIELSEVELALLYHTVMADRGEHRAVLWEREGRRERRYVSENWLENKVFSRIAEVQPDWLPAMEEAQKRLSLYKGA